MRSKSVATLYLNKRPSKLKSLLKYYLSLYVLLACSNPLELQAQCYENVTFEEWVTTGDSTSSAACAGGGWILGAGDSTLSSQCNSLFPLMYVGPDTLINVKITGTFEIATNSDDDYVGFVFGFKDTWDYTWKGGNTDTMYHNYYLFDWKKNAQTWSGYAAQEGYSLCKVDTALARTNPQVFPNFWNHNNSAGFQVLQTQFSNTSGWVSFTEYDFELYYTPTRAVITINGDTFIDQGGCFEPGLFGFYSFSQEGTDYWDFNYELYIDFGMESQSVCLGDTSQFYFIDTGACYSTNTYTNLDTFWWDLGDGTVSLDTNPWHIYYSAGLYDVYLVATDINGCTDTAHNLVYIHEAPNAAIGFGDVCKGDSVFFGDSTSLPIGYIAEWDWDFGDGSTNGQIADPVHLYNQSGYYTVQLAVEDNAGCVDTTDTVIQIYPNPVPQFSIQDACDGLDVILIDSSQEGLVGISSLEWDVENNGTVDYNADSVGHTYSTHGQYAVQLIVYDSLGCRDSLTQLTTVYPMPVADFEVPSVCFKENSVFQDSSTVATGYFTGWNWDFGDGSISTSNTPQYQFQTSGQHTIELKVTTDGGCQDSLTKNITVYHLPVAAVELSPNCENLPVNFIQNSTSQSGMITQYHWDFGDGGSSLSSGPIHDYAAPGLYPISLEVITQYGCADTVYDSIQIYPAPQAAFNWENNVCEGDPLPIFDQSNIAQSTPGGDNIVSWNWNVNGTPLTTQNPTYVTSNSEKIDVFLLVTSNYGCVDSTRNWPEIFPIPDAKFTEDMACTGLPSKFTDLSTISKGLVDNWSWDFGNGNVSDSADPTNVYLTSGDFKVKLVVKSNKGCLQETEHMVHVPVTPEVNFDIEPKVGCSPLAPRAINLSSIADGELTYKWYVNNEKYSDLTSPRLDLVNDTIETIFFNVKLVATSEAGCTASKKKSEIVAVYPRPIANFNFDRQSLDLFNPVILFENTSEQSVRWKWDFNDGKTSQAFSPLHDFQKSGMYHVSLKAWNEYNCLDTIMQVVKVDAITTLYMPTSFTPNGDGVNDFWSIEGFNEGGSFEIKIWDRWGHTMLHEKDINFTWDGKNSDNKIAQNGVYTYQILYQTSEGEYQEIHGAFTLIR